MVRLCKKHAGGNVEAFCRMLGIHKTTYYRQVGRKKLTSHVELAIIKMNGDGKD
jgi:transcriptional regulator of acetoin/glycerol metabolism